MTATPGSHHEPTALSKRIKALRLNAGLNARNVAVNAGVSYSAYRTWESGTSTPLLSRLERLVSALGVPACALSAPDGYVAVTDVQLTPQAVARVRALGEPEAERLAHQIAAQLPAMILATCRTTRLNTKPDGRGKPRRSRAEVLAGIAEANAMRAAKARPPTGAGPPQDRAQDSVGGLPGALTAEE